MNHPMRTRGVLCVCLCSFVTSALAALPAAAAQKKSQEEAPPAPPVVIKYLGSQKTRQMGKEVLMVSGVTAIGGRQVTLAIRNKDKDKYSPDERMDEAVKGAKPGDYLLTETKMEDYKLWLTRLEPYKAKEGEEQPNNFIFDDTYPTKDKSGEKEVQTVALKKFGNHIEAVLAMKRDEASKQMVTDPDLLATVGKFKKGDIVEAEIRTGKPPVIQTIDPYKPAQEAKMVKMAEGDVAEGVKGPAVELDQGGKPVTVLIPGRLVGQKWAPDMKMAGLAKNIKPGTSVMFRTRESDGKNFLKDIQPAAKAPSAAKEKAPTATKEKAPAASKEKGKEKEPPMKETK